jgi:hypothetical protein
MTHPARLIFTHVPKTGGTSLRGVLGRHYPASHSMHIKKRDNYNNARSILTQPKAQRDALRLIAGHLSYGIHPYLDGPSIHVTLLRHPVKRLISDYFFTRSLSDDKKPENFMQTSIEEYAQNPQHNQPFVRAFYGFNFDPTSPERPSDPFALPADALEIAKNNLREHYQVVGLTEEFDASLMLMKRALGWKNVYYHVMNVTRQDPLRDKLSPETIQVIEQACAQDIAFYNYAKTLFEAQKAAYGLDALAKDIADFRARNAWFGRIYTLSQRLRDSAPYRALRRLTINQR